MNYIQKAQKELAKKIKVDKELLDLYTLLFFVKGKDCTLENIHDAWSVWKNNSAPDHKSLVPFDELSEEVQDLDKKYDKKYMEVIKSLEIQKRGEADKQRT